MLTSTLQIPSQMAETDLDEAITVFLAERSHMLSAAYRILGEIAASEDVVQEAWLRWQRTDRGAIDNPAAFLNTTATHLAINVIKSARHRRETPADAPLAAVADRSQDPTKRAELVATVDQALRLLMTRLTPAQGAVYLLRKSFDFSYQEIARMLRIAVPNARQLARRAQRDLAADRHRHVDPDQHRRLVRAFLSAAHTGEFAELERLLATATVTPRPPAGSLGQTTTPGSEEHRHEQPLPRTSGPGSRQRHRGSPTPVPARS
jgi:RNA polymerase sigma factor (sigma-70 family)